MNLSDLNLKTATWIDVRTENEFAQEHLEGAINIPLDQIFTRIENFKNMSKPIVLYCRSGSRSQMALEILKAQGIEEVFNGGGLQEIMQYLN